MTLYANVVDSLPPHLKQYVVEQDYSRYTAMEQATWRFVLRQLKSFLTKNAHHCYVEGLEKTGISVEEIPRIDVMCEKLQQFGWTALPVSGFIPPAAFMELQSLNILPIASDMRSMEHILYTPAPDIVHEAAGHAPILVDVQFAAYLKKYASIAKKAILSHEDLAQYEAIRELSDIKESPQSTPQDILAAEKKLSEVNSKMSFVSEAALLGRMNWWTAEYGLIGDIDNPKIFGAGLLSSVGESRAVNNVKKIPLTVDCIETPYDITEQQPQLFVTPDFEHLSQVLHELENKMAFKRGGIYGLEKALQAQTVNTVQLDSGVQISGKIVDFKKHEDSISFFKMEGPVQVCYQDQQLTGQGTERHPQGFSSPIGISKEYFQSLALIKNQPITLNYPGEIELQATIDSWIKSPEGQLLVLTLSNCTITHKSENLYQPEWGLCDLVIGKAVTSVFSGPADRASYGQTENFVKKLVPRQEPNAQTKEREHIYLTLRALRTSSHHIIPQNEIITSLYEKTLASFPEDWLAFLEILELAHSLKMDHAFREQVLIHLQKLKLKNTNMKDYIDLGLDLVEQVI